MLGTDEYGVSIVSQEYQNGRKLVMCVFGICSLIILLSALNLTSRVQNLLIAVGIREHLNIAQWLPREGEVPGFESIWFM